MLKMTLNEIRGKIQIYPENWINVSTTNCYAYALGLDIKESEICKSAYQPGTIAMDGIIDPILSRDYFLYSILIKKIEDDLKTLNILYREIEPNDLTLENEWKMALFTEVYATNSSDELITNFHFLRTNKNNVWIHKPDYYAPPRKKDYENYIISDLKKCYLDSYEYKKCYALKLNK